MSEQPASTAAVHIVPVIATASGPIHGLAAASSCGMYGHNIYYNDVDDSHTALHSRHNADEASGDRRGSTQSEHYHNHSPDARKHHDKGILNRTATAISNTTAAISIKIGSMHGDHSHKGGSSNDGHHIYDRYGLSPSSHKNGHHHGHGLLGALFSHKKPRSRKSTNESNAESDSLEENTHPEAERRSSGDSILDAFRPRSKSDPKPRRRVAASSQQGFGKSPLVAAIYRPEKNRAVERRNTISAGAAALGLSHRASASKRPNLPSIPSTAEMGAASEALYVNTSTEQAMQSTQMEQDLAEDQVMEMDTDAPFPRPRASTYEPSRLKKVAPKDIAEESDNPSYHKVPLGLRRQSLDSALDLSPTYKHHHTMINGFRFLALNEGQKLSIYKRLLCWKKCYDVIPLNSKLIAFDTTLPVKKAFYALVHNGVRAAVLWDDMEKRYVGMLTITDFINVLRRYHEHNSQAFDPSILEEETIDAWKSTHPTGTRTEPAKLISIHSESSLYEAVNVLCEKKVHRLPVIDDVTGNVLYIITHKRILRFLSLYNKRIEPPSFMSSTPRILEIGSWGSEVKTATPQTRLIDALDMLVEHGISALPVVNDAGQVVDIYSRFDVIHLASSQAYRNLDASISEVLDARNNDSDGWFEEVHCCLDTDSFHTVMERLVTTSVHRILVTDTDKRLAGLISLSDVLKFLAIKAPELSQQD